MALVVENGTGLANANCYVSKADFLAYCDVRNLDLDAYSSPQIEAAIVVAAKDWEDGEHDFISDPLTDTQSMKWPRVNYGLPQAIIEANNRAAHMQLFGLLLVDYAAMDTKGDIVEESSGLATLKDSVKYAEGTAQRYGRVLPASLTNLLKPYLALGGGMKVYRG